MSGDTIRAATTQLSSEQDSSMSEMIEPVRLETKRQKREVINPPRSHVRYPDPNQVTKIDNPAGGSKICLMKIGADKYTIIDEQYVDDVKAYSWHFCNGYAQHNKTKEFKARFGGEKGGIYLHEFILIYCEKHHKSDPGTYVDHRNRCSQDNRACNLRFATPGQNTSNRIYKRESTGIQELDVLNKAEIHEFPRFINFRPEGGKSDKHGDRFGIEDHPNSEKSQIQGTSKRDVHIAVKYRQILKMVIDLDGGHDYRTGLVTTSEEDAETQSIFDEANAHILNVCVEKGIEVDVNDPEVFFKLEQVENTCAGHLRKLENYYKFVTSSESHGRELGPREIKDEGTDEDGDIVVHQDSSMTLTRGKMMPEHWSFLKAAGVAGNRDVGLNYRDKAAGVDISSTRKRDNTLKYKYIELLGKLVGGNVTSEDQCLEMLDTLVEKNIISQEEKAGSIVGIKSGEDFENWYYKMFPMDIVVVHQDSSMTLTRDIMPEHWSFLEKNKNCDIGLDYRDKSASVRITSNQQRDKTLKYKYIELLGKLVGGNVTSEDQCLEMLDTLVEKNIISQEEKAGSIAGIASGKDISSWYYKVFLKDVVVVHQDSSMTLTRDIMPEHWTFHNKNKNYGNGLIYKAPGVKPISSNRKKDGSLKDKYMDLLGKLVKENVTSKEECLQMLEKLVAKEVISADEKAAYLCTSGIQSNGAAAEA